MFCWSYWSLLSNLRHVPPNINEWEVCKTDFSLRKGGERKTERWGTTKCCWEGVPIIDAIASEESSSGWLKNESHLILSHNQKEHKIYYPNGLLFKRKWTLIVIILDNRHKLGLSPVTYVTGALTESPFCVSGCFISVIMFITRQRLVRSREGLP